MSLDRTGCAGDFARASLRCTPIGVMNAKPLTLAPLQRGSSEPGCVKQRREGSGGCVAGVRGRLCAAEERSDRRKKKRACLSPQGEFARFPPGTSTAREPEGPAHLKPPGPCPPPAPHHAPPGENHLKKRTHKKNRQA